MGCSGSAILAQSADEAWEGPYTPIPIHANPPVEHCCEIAHAILIGKPGPAQGKVLLILSNGDRWMWDPAAPNSVGTEAYCDMLPPTENMFCAGHSADSNGDIVVSGGARRRIGHPPTSCEPQPRYSFVYQAETGCWSANYPMLVPSPALPDPNFHNLGYYYPSTLRLPDGRVISVGGGSDPLTSDANNPTVPSGACGDTGQTFFVDGWQLLEPTTSAWVGAIATNWFPGLLSSYTAAPGVVVPIQFNYYPLLMLMRSWPTTVNSGYVFAAVVTDNRHTNLMSAAGFVPKRSPSAWMSLGAGGPTTWSWSVHSSQINRPGTATPRNLYYPSGFHWPMHLNDLGLPTAPPRFVVLGGTDQNDYLSGSPGAPNPLANPHPGGGRPALAEVQSIENPESPSSAWTTGLLPSLTIGRIYTNAVVLPDEHLFVVGGSEFDFLPFKGQSPGAIPAVPDFRKERIASPVFFPEMIDLANAGTPWVVCPPHVSPRLYHAMALLLPDGRVLVCGGYRGKKAPANPNWPGSGPQFLISDPEHHTFHDFEHSDIEIFSPDYLFAGARPQILSITGGNSIAYRTGPGSAFEVAMAFPGQANPAQAIGSVCLISPGSLTHHYDWDQRFVRLTASATASNRLSIVPPADRNVAPPGMYMLFITSDPNLTGGVKIPSVAAFVNLQ